MSKFRRVTETSCTRPTSHLGELLSPSNSERIPVLKSPDGSGEVPNTVFARSDAAEQVGTPPLLYILQKEKNLSLKESHFKFSTSFPNYAYKFRILGRTIGKTINKFTKLLTITTTPNTPFDQDKFIR